jgi:hypothetical protein
MAASCGSGAMGSTRAPSACQNAVAWSTAAGEARPPGQTKQIRSRKRPGSAADGPDRSFPAMGWHPTNRPVDIAASTAAMTAPFTLPTSITRASGETARAIRLARAPRLPTGAASTTRAAPATASSGVAAASSRIPRSRAVAAAAGSWS